MSNQRFTIKEGLYYFEVIDNEDPYFHSIIFNNKEEQWKVETLVEWLNRLSDNLDKCCKKIGEKDE